MRYLRVILNAGVLFAAIGFAAAFGVESSEEWIVGPGDTIRGSLGQGDAVYEQDDTYYDAYVLPVSADQRYRVSLSSSDFDTYLLINDHVTGELYQDDDGGPGTDSMLSFVPEGDGFVVIGVNSVQIATGAYELQIR